MDEEIKYSVSRGNVFKDLEVPDPDSHLAKAQRVLRISRAIESMKISQAEAAKIMGIDPPKVSALLRGQFREYSFDQLARFLNALGHDM